MDSIIYWIGVLVRILLGLVLLRLCVWGVFWLVERVWGVAISASGWRFGRLESLTVKTQSLEVQVNGIFLTVRWLDPTCRHFLKVNISGVHTEYFLLSWRDTAKKPAVVKPKDKPPPPPVPTRKKRLVYWCFCQLVKLLELSVHCLEVCVYDAISADTSLVTMFQVLGHMDAIAQPLPDKELAISLEVEKAVGQLFLHSDKPCPTTEDGMYPLAELSLSTKVFLFLRPLKSHGRLLNSMQINTAPLSLALIQEDAVEYAVQYLLNSTKDGGSSAGPSTSTLSKLPEKLEIVLEDVTLRYHARGSNRSITSNVTRVSMAATLAFSRPEDKGNLPKFSVTVGLHELSIKDPLSRKILRLHQLRVVSEHSSDVLSNSVQVNSAHVSIWEGETAFWIRYLLDTINTYRTKMKSDQKRRKTLPAKQRIYKFLNQLFALPVSVVTTVELSDWSIQLRLDAGTLQSKEPVCRLVVASCAVNLQWVAMQEDSTTVRASVRLEDSYLHVPGFHPTINNSAYYRQRVDNPGVLPSLRKHLWGRAISLGSLTLKAEKDIGMKSEGSTGAKEVLFLNDPLRISGEGCSLMLEWSKPTEVTLARTLGHMKQEYCFFGAPSKTLSGSDRTEQSVLSKKVDASGVSDKEISTVDPHTGGNGSVLERLGVHAVDLRFQLMDVNVFIYGLTPDPPALMVRLDAASLSSLCPPSFHLDLHGLLMDDMTLMSTEPAFLCSPIASLPKGVGVAVLTTVVVKHDSRMKDLSATVAKLMVDWNMTAHRSLFHTFSCIWDDIQEMRDLFLKLSSSSSSTRKKEGVVTSLGELGKTALARVPISVIVNVETAECHAQVDRRAKVSLALQTSHCRVNDGSLVADVYEVGVNFDQHRIITLEGVVGQFPHSSEQLLVQRRAKVGKNRMEKMENPTVGLQATRVELMFPYKYNFAATLDKVLNIRKFLQQVHSSGDGSGSLHPLLLSPDVFIEVGDIVFQLCDDPFEVKLRANYELMCDENGQKSQRLQALEKKLEEFRKEKGEFLSAKKVQSLYDSLDVKDSEIYCQRVREMYGSEPLRTSLFVFSMQQTNLLAMFDPSMLGEEKLVAQLKDIDDNSPFPEGKYSFSTLWGMYVSGDTQKLQLQLRDYPQPLLAMTEVTISGKMLFAEQEAQERERRLAVVEVGQPWGNTTICRKLPPLKYYYDFEMGAKTTEYSYGPCLEPALAETNLGFSCLTSPTIDPSKPLPYWDKLRLLFHGRLHLTTKEMAVILPATTNPYNNVEFLELRLGDLDARLLTNTRLDLEGSLQLIVHTASKYDECEILNFPHVCSSFLCKWYCGGRDPNNHHAVVRCAPDKLPIRHDKQEHDSYSAFRSQNLNLEWSLDVQPQTPEDQHPPSIVLYASTLRCLQQYQTLISSNVTRPIKRGNYFNYPKRKRSTLIRHWRDVQVSASLPESLLQYWSSVARQQGVECTVDKGEFSIHYDLTLTAVEDGLKHRPRANWTILSCEGSTNKLSVWVQRRMEATEQREEQQGLDVVEEEEEEEEVEEEGREGEPRDEHTKCILLSMAELTYKRQESSSASGDGNEDFKHLLKTYNTRMLWSASNRKVVMGLYDAYKQAQTLKRDLSTEALKSILMKLDTPVKDTSSDQHPPPALVAAAAAVVDDGDHPPPHEPSPSHPRLMRHSSSGCVMLDQLLADIENKFVSYAEERAPSDPVLKGIKAGSWKDVTQKNWLVELTNTQIALQGIEHHGFVLASSSIAQVFGCDHEPRLREGDLVTKKSLICKVLDMQYFATFSPSLDPDYIPWLPLSVICPPAIGTQEPNTEAALHDEESSLNALLSELGPEDDTKDTRDATLPGEAVGGLVSCLLVARDDSDMRGGLGGSKETIQLQRIASRCHCQIFYVTYGGQVEAEACKTPPSILSPKGHTPSGLYDSSNEAVDTFTFRYPTVEVCTTSTQYALIMDILNNLLLHKEPRKKEALVKHSRMQFTLQLSDIRDPRKPVLVQQNKVRKYLQTIRELETQLFLEQKSGDSSLDTQLELEVKLSAAKEELSTASMKLRAMIRAFKESLIYMAPPSGTEHTEVPEPVRRIEVWLDDAHWSLTQDDGQLQVADIRLTNFSYNRVSFNDDSGEHRLELGTFKVLNLMPNTHPVYQQVLTPYDPKSRHLRVDKNISLRVYCRDKAPVAGIAVIEHLEFNVVPLAVSLTSRFYQTMQDFFFPKAEGEGQGQGEVTESDHTHLFGPGGVQPTPASGDDPDGNGPLLTRASSVRRSTLSVSSTATTVSSTSGTLTSSPPVSPSPKEVQKGGHHATPRVDDVEKMRERASHIKTFIYVKIPQTSLCITYKSESVSFKDLQNQLVTVPTLEYHNNNWTWTNMLMEVKRDYKNAIVHQTLKSAIGMKESEETAGLASPKLRRHASDMLLGRTKGSKQTKGRKLFGKLGGSREEIDKERAEGARLSYQPPLMEPEINLKRTYKRLTKLSQEAQK